MAKAKEQELIHSDETRQNESPLTRSHRADIGSLRHASPFSFMRRFSEEMDRLFEDVGFGNWSGHPFSSRRFDSFTWAPQVETFQRNGQFVVRADLPGLTKDDIKVGVEENCLTIEGERKKEWTTDQESGGGYRSERSYGQFYRCIQLPQGASPDSVSANFRDGVLEVTLPAPERPQAKRIEVKG